MSKRRTTKPNELPTPAISETKTKPEPDVRAAVEAMKRFREGRTLGGLSVREMIDEGRRF
jgi:hypothetical protein